MASSGLHHRSSSMSYVSHNIKTSSEQTFITVVQSGDLEISLISPKTGRKNRIALPNFADLINPTPFRKPHSAPGNLPSMKQASSSPRSPRNVIRQGSPSRSSGRSKTVIQNSAYPIQKNQGLKRMITTHGGQVYVNSLRTSRFALESQRQRLDVSNSS